MFSPIRARASFVGLTALTLLASSSALRVEAYAQATGAPTVAAATPGTGAAMPGQGQATGTGASSESKGPCKATITFPAFGGVIKQNPDPACFSLPGAGEIYLGGALTGYAYRETNPFPFTTPPLGGDRRERVDFTNAQIFVQKPEGFFQFYLQAGAYAIPALGIVNYSTIDQTQLFFSPVPVVFGKLQFSDNFSIQGGRMPTLIGVEAPFTFQNLNIQRGLLFNQENVINHGVQVNYSNGPLTVSVAGTDGFFAGDITWFTGAVTYKLDDSNTIGINGGFNAGRTDVLSRPTRAQFATPLFQQNSGIFVANYTYSNGPWTVTPYFQFTNVNRDARLGILQSASTYGGALLASYAFNDLFALAGRVEYETQTGRPGSGTTSLLYGPGSSAASFTITPTFTFDRAFVRAEYSLVKVYDITRGDLNEGTTGTAFGRTGNRTTQERVMIEAGITF